MILSTRRHLLAIVAGVFAPAALAQPPADNLVFDVRNGDQEGKLFIKDSELAFESLSDARQSRTWKYAEIRELSRRKKEMRVRPYKGSRYDFQFKDSKVRDQLYDLISQRVLAARQNKK
ncbi:MAG: hypothetical protein JNN08_15285 [Bryobacterales bacterium]|nr:hypothetical protein [Bryobacterales bacterium]